MTIGCLALSAFVQDGKSRPICPSRENTSGGFGMVQRRYIDSSEPIHAVTIAVSKADSNNGKNYEL
jgi:hypothetical protein